MLFKSPDFRKMAKHRCKSFLKRSDKTRLIQIGKQEYIATIQLLKTDFQTGERCCDKCIKRAKEKKATSLKGIMSSMRTIKTAFIDLNL